MAVTLCAGLNGTLAVDSESDPRPAQGHTEATFLGSTRSRLVDFPQYSLSSARTCPSVCTSSDKNRVEPANAAKKGRAPDRPAASDYAASAGNTGAAGHTLGDQAVRFPLLEMIAADLLFEIFENQNGDVEFPVSRAALGREHMEDEPMAARQCCYSRTQAQS